ncbi:tetratricopeptide repeat-containing sulfotransferase family protein [Nitrospira sp. Nam80]
MGMRYSSSDLEGHETSDQSLRASIQAALDRNDPVAAKRLCEEHLRTLPDDPDAHRYLGHVLMMLGNREGALNIAARATVLAPDDPRVWSDLGRIRVLSGHMGEAVSCFEKAVELVPDYADGWHNLGLALRQTGRTQRAFDALKQALLIDPTRAETYLSLGNLLVDARQLEDAIGCFERAVAYDPSMAKTHTRLAQELSHRGDVDRAESLFRRSLSLDPDNVESWFGLGRTLEDLGQADVALSCYRNVLERQPGHALALGHYLAFAKNDDGQEWIDQLEPALDRTDGSPEAKALMGYGLTKWYDRRGRFREAASAGIRANAARRTAAGSFNRPTLTARIDAIIDAYPAEFFVARRHIGIGTDQPVFIVGLPRSGTTLTEQILSAHPLLHGAGELPDLARLAAKSLEGADAAPWQAALRLDDTMTGHRFAHEYLAALRHSAPANSRRISDKQPLNFFHLAFAALLFPNARVLHCRRDPRDNALSIWMENFNRDQTYATDFEDLAHFMTEYRRLMAHWHGSLPLQILDIQYEDTVADLEKQSRRIMAFLKVPWDERCLDFHQVDRAVQTPSRWQVRQPIYNRSVGRWRTYREYLPELETAFADLGGDGRTTA